MSLYNTQVRLLFQQLIAGISDPPFPKKNLRCMSNGPLNSGAYRVPKDVDPALMDGTSP